MASAMNAGSSSMNNRTTATNGGSARRMSRALEMPAKRLLRLVNTIPIASAPSAQAASASSRRVNPQNLTRTRSFTG